MKKYFEYILLFAITCFSFYYTEKVTKIMREKDPVMKSILKYKEDNYEECREGYETSEGVVLGVPGVMVDVDSSYRAMQGYGYQEDLMVFREVKCDITKDTVKNKYIIKGNPATLSVSLFIEVKDLSYIKDIVKIAKYKNIKLNLVVNGSILEKEKDYMSELYNLGFDIVYGGNDKEDLKKYINIMNNISKKPRTYCINISKDNLDICSDKNITTLKTSNIYMKDIFLNTKKNLQTGEFFVYGENANTKEEISSLINFILGKQIKIVNVSNMLF